MELITILSFTLGNAIAKAIIVEWLGDNKLLENITADLMDLVRDNSMSDTDKRNAMAQVEQIGQQLVMRLRAKYAAMPHRSDLNPEAVIFDVAITSSKANISLTSLVESQLNPNKVYSELRDLRPDVTKTFSTHETSLYHSLLKLLSEELVNLSTELIGFLPLVTSKTWENQDRILDAINTILTQPTHEAAEFEMKYRNAVNNALDTPDIFGIPYADRLARSQRLSTAYIPLRATTGQALRALQLMDLSDFAKLSSSSIVPDLDTSFNRVYEEISKSGFGKSSSLSIESGLNEFVLSVSTGIGKTAVLEKLMKYLTPDRSIEQVLAQSRRLVLRGDAGSGKSTLLKWIAVTAARQDFTGILSRWNELVPFYIRLRERVNKDFPTPEEFPKLTARMIAGRIHTDDWTHQVLESGRAIVLIDGVDELPRPQRKDMLDQLAQLVKLYPLARYIITSRPSAIKSSEWPEWEDWVKQEEFSIATLQPMEPHEIDSFIEHWHAALKQSLNLTQTETDRMVNSLKRIRKQRRPLARLATSPLLCAMICALHHERGGHNLPSERIKLYSDCVEMLVEKRDEARRIPLGDDYPDLGYDQKLELIRHFAFWMMRNDYTEVTQAEADKFFNDYLSKTTHKDISGTQVRKFFVDRTSLLREPTLDGIDFTHRTFQEFLTAQAIFDNNEFGLLLGKVRNDQWREVIILTSGYAGTLRRGERTKFLKNLVNKAKKYKREENKKQVLLLSIAALEGSAGLEMAAQEYVLEQATEVFPPKSEDDVKQIAIAGDPAISLLQYRLEYENNLRWCVETLGLIGSIEAMNALVDYTELENGSVIRKLWDIRANFEREIYFKQVLSHCRVLHCNSVSSLVGFEYLTSLCELYIYKLTKPLHITELAKLSNLKALSLHGDNVNDLSHIAHLHQLKKLDVSQTEIDNLQAIAPLVNLTELNLSGCPVSDMTPLTHLSRLCKLDISNTKTQDISFLEKITQIQSLNIAGLSIKDLFPLDCLQKLTELIIDHTEVDDVSFITSFLELSHLGITGLRVSKLDPLLQLPNLSSLEISLSQLNLLEPIVENSSLSKITININDYSNDNLLFFLEFLNGDYSKLFDFAGKDSNIYNLFMQWPVKSINVSNENLSFSLIKDNPESSPSNNRMNKTH
ncbi:MAG: NACHT domain-containing protein [Anaerolineae bacterium]|nr:NACHT domain-containing protein [Anaerolineae bacterium]